MFERIAKYISETKLLSSDGLQEIDRFLKQLLDKTLVLEKILERIKIKYDFENLSRLEINQGIIEGKTFYFNRIGFWMERYEFDLSLGIEGDIDKEFFFIVNRSDVFIQNLNEEQKENEQELIYDFAFKIFYTWIGFLWQKKKLYDCGVPMCIEVNSETMTYYLNDYLKSYYSEYDEIYPRKRLLGRSFIRDLTIEEVFISTYFFRNSLDQMNLYCEKNNLFIEIIMNNNRCSFYKGEIGRKGELIDEIELKSVHNNELKEESSIYYMVKQFKRLVNDNWEFKLRKK